MRDGVHQPPAVTYGFQTSQEGCSAATMRRTALMSDMWVRVAGSCPGAVPWARSLSRRDRACRRRRAIAHFVAPDVDFWASAARRRGSVARSTSGPVSTVSPPLASACLAGKPQRMVSPRRRRTRMRYRYRGRLLWAPVSVTPPDQAAPPGELRRRRCESSRPDLCDFRDLSASSTEGSASRPEREILVRFGNGTRAHPGDSIEIAHMMRRHLILLAAILNSGRAPEAKQETA
jgi:hypothetical protein